MYRDRIEFYQALEQEFDSDYFGAKAPELSLPQLR